MVLLSAWTRDILALQVHLVRAASQTVNPLSEAHLGLQLHHSLNSALIWHRPCCHCPAWNSFNIENILNSTLDHEVFLLDLLFFFRLSKLQTIHIIRVSLHHISRWYNWSCSVECTCNNSLCLSPSTWSATLLVWMSSTTDNDSGHGGQSFSHQKHQPLLKTRVIFTNCQISQDTLSVPPHIQQKNSMLSKTSHIIILLCS